MRLTIASDKAVKFACLNFHYAKSVPVNTIGFNVYNDAGEWCGVILYGGGANNHIGSKYGLCSGEVLELVRVALNGKQGTGKTSQAVSMSLKALKENCPLVRLIVSYADADENHLGTTYQATNWIYVGMPYFEIPGTKNDCYIVHGKKTHKRSLHWIKEKYGRLDIDAVRKYADPNAEIFRTKGKRKYLYPLDKKIRKLIEPLSRPYPKGEGWEKIDRRKFHGAADVPRS